MAESCGSNCSSCGENCPSRQAPQSMIENTNEYSNVHHVIGVVSGKGGVGKSLITSLLASEMNKRGYRVAILDGDITGPSIPKVFGLTEKAMATEDELFPVESPCGIQIMSMNLLMDDETQPVIWRGPVIAGAVKQFYTEVSWGEIDYMFVDMPPGTGDVPLTVFQSLPVEGIVVVTSPQELVSMIVGKAVNMANQMDIPILGLVENMSYLECPDCGKKIPVFGESKVEAVAKEYGIEKYAQIPINPEIASRCDAGQVELIDGVWLEEIIERIRKGTLKK